jgi:hypothetical protein
MATYKILSDNFSFGKQGETIDSDLLDGCNIQALVDGGHLAEANTKFSKQDIKETDK